MQFQIKLQGVLCFIEIFLEKYAINYIIKVFPFYVKEFFIYREKLQEMRNEELWNMLTHFEKTERLPSAQELQFRVQLIQMGVGNAHHQFLISNSSFLLEISLSLIAVYAEKLHKNMQQKENISKNFLSL